MPLVRIGARLVYFAHVPKCGGTAVALYLAERFGPPAFLDRDFMKVPGPRRWSKTSPQHIDAASLARLFPPGFIDHAFAIVRHPVARIVSAYHFHREVETKGALRLAFPDWLATMEARLAATPFARDNHLAPMHAMIPAGATVFRLEDGMAPVLAHVDALAGAADGARSIPTRNARSQRRKAYPEPRVVPGPTELARIIALYAEDFARYGYDPDRPPPEEPA
jgi:hypothetical protein